MTRSRTGSFEPDVDGDETDVIRTPHRFRETEPQRTMPDREPWENSANIKFEEFTRSVTLGLFDSMTKSRSNGVVISLSGGTDSASVAVLARLMFDLAAQSLEPGELTARLEYAVADASSLGPAGLARKMVTTVYQSTSNSGDVTRNAARRLAEAINARHLEFDVDSIVNRYVEMVGDSLGREITWESDDIALQNIQARARSPGVWMLANIFNALLLTTSNRSEAAVGYATMDGDTSGGLGPIAGIDKAFLCRWLKWVETSGPTGLFSIPELEAVTVQAPTAELRPPDAGQTDEEDLMPYERLDEIERLAIRDKRTPLEVFRELRNEWSETDAEQIGRWIEKFFRLWSRNQWKRERYAPSFHLDDENLDPKTWCRYPILSGGNERELREMWQFIRDRS